MPAAAPLRRNWWKNDKFRHLSACHWIHSCQPTSQNHNQHAGQGFRCRLFSASGDVSCNQGRRAVITGSIPCRGHGVQAGQTAQLVRTFTAKDVQRFAHLIGDWNPLHFPPEKDNGDTPAEVIQAAEATEAAAVVHGMLTSSLFSTIFGTLVPGSIYCNQSLNFKSPIYAGEEIIGRVVVTKVRQTRLRSKIGSGNGVMCTCDTLVAKTNVIANRGENVIIGSEARDESQTVCVTGEARVWLPGAFIAAES